MKNWPNLYGMRSLNLTTFFGRTVSHVIIDQHTILRFTDFAINFQTKVNPNQGGLSSFIGKKLLYVQRLDSHVHFHFTNDLILTIDIALKADVVPKYLVLQYRDREVILMVDEETAFDGV
jgi:hypothetical protein